MSVTLLANRAPVRRTDDGWKASLGGLATALLPVLTDRGGVWVAMREPDEVAPVRQPFPSGNPAFEIRRIPLDVEAFEGYYNGMANQVLWPLSHYLIDRVQPDRMHWGIYKDVNRRFAETALAEGDAETLYFVQDYHLTLTPGFIRAARPTARIGHMWHIPWPAPEVFRILPSARPLLKGMLGADLIGFHTEGYADNFREATRQLLGTSIRGNTILWEGRKVRAEARPIGVDVEKFEKWGRSEKIARKADKLRRRTGADYLILAVDRLDYTKGLLLRLMAFEEFLGNHPELHGRVTLFQVATPSRTGIAMYEQLKREVDEAVGRINGMFSQGNWQPVRYRYRTYTQKRLAVLYRAADVALITPLRDGMNLVAHEFAAVSEDGVLVLSELTGAADYLEGTMTVNPYDTDGLCQTLHAALRMPKDERLEGMKKMRSAVRKLDVHRWANRFLGSLECFGGTANRTAVDGLAGEPQPA